jgi:hypothetical protein
MKLTFSKRAGYLATGCLAGFVASMALTPSLLVFAQIPQQRSFDNLSEVQAYIRSCRQVIPVNGSVAVYDNTQLADKPANRIGTINVGTPMHLTGVIQDAEGEPTAVQVYMPYRRFAMHQPVGWVDASRITTC